VGDTFCCFKVGASAKTVPPTKQDVREKRLGSSTNAKIKQDVREKRLGSSTNAKIKPRQVKPRIKSTKPRKPSYLLSGVVLPIFQNSITKLTTLNSEISNLSDTEKVQKKVSKN
jgi:hypothetical protein